MVVHSVALRKRRWFWAAAISASILLAPGSNAKATSDWQIAKKMTPRTFKIDYVDGPPNRPRAEVRPPVMEGIFFLDDNNGWLVGESGTVAHTSDAGTTWSEKLLNPPDNFKAVSFISPLRGWMVGYRWVRGKGNSGIVQATDDGGSTWHEQYNGQGLRLSWLYDVCMVDDQNGWAVGEGEKSDRAEGPIIIHTNDGGREWKLQYFDETISFSLKNVHFKNKLQGWAGGPMALLHTDDGGKHWYAQRQQVEPGPFGYRQIRFLSLLEGWAVGAGTLLLHTTDGGTEWTTIPMPLNEKKNLKLMYISFLNSNEGSIVAVDGTIFHTKDGGKTWEQESSDLDTDIKVACATSRSFFGFTSEGAIIRKDR